MLIDNIHLKWNLPKNIRIMITSRKTGYSKYPYNNCNLALHVGDNPKLVNMNRDNLIDNIKVPVYYLNQTHSNNIINLDLTKPDNNYDYDASFTTSINKACCILTADCVPLLLTNTKGEFVAAIHVGWKGILNNIIDNTIKQINNYSGADIIAYVGPHICEKHFEVKQDLYDIFMQHNKLYNVFFKKKDNVTFYCNLYKMIENVLLANNVLQNNIYNSGYCTYCNNDLFYSYRKEKITGRFASLIWKI